jgi:hypothetical protein
MNKNGTAKQLKPWQNKPGQFPANIPRESVHKKRLSFNHTIRKMAGKTAADIFDNLGIPMPKRLMLKKCIEIKTSDPEIVIAMLKEKTGAKEIELAENGHIKIHDKIDFVPKICRLIIGGGFDLWMIRVAPEVSNKDLIVCGVYAKAISGNLAAAEFITDRVDGKPVQPVEMVGDDRNLVAVEELGLELRVEILRQMLADAEGELEDKRSGNMKIVSEVEDAEEVQVVVQQDPEDQYVIPAFGTGSENGDGGQGFGVDAGEGAVVV